MKFIHDESLKFINHNRYFKEKFILGCIKNDKGKNPKNLEFGPHGIIDNHAYGILDVREVKLFKM